VREATEQMSAALLCGGGSSRLGFPKEMVRVGGRPLGAVMADRLKEIFPSVIVISNESGFLRPHVDVPIYEDKSPGKGPLAGIEVGLTYCESDRCFFLAVDMPLVHNGLICRLVDAAAKSDAQAIVPKVSGHVQPVCGVYDQHLLVAAGECLSKGGSLSLAEFLQTIDTEYVQMDQADAGCFRDLDYPSDLAILRDGFEDVEPLPVQHILVRKTRPCHDLVVEEWPVAVYVNDIRLVTVMCLPSALRELAVGLASYLSLVQYTGAVGSISVDYEQKRVRMEVDVEDERIRKATQLLITSTCGANVYGSPLTVAEEAGEWTDFRVAADHILEVASGMRDMSPVFDRTGGTHQAAFTDGEEIQFFFEDIGRHNAVDKVVGRALMEGKSLEKGAIVTTGRISSEMVVKAVRAKVPVLASRSAVTIHACRLAKNYGLTLAGFARGGRLNAYTKPERIV